MTFFRNVQNISFFWSFSLIKWSFFASFVQVRGARARLWEESEDSAEPTEVRST